MRRNLGPGRCSSAFSDEALGVLLIWGSWLSFLPVLSPPGILGGEPHPASVEGGPRPENEKKRARTEEKSGIKKNRLKGRLRVWAVEQDLLSLHPSVAHLTIAVVTLDKWLNLSDPDDSSVNGTRNGTEFLGVAMSIK